MRSPSPAVARLTIKVERYERVASLMEETRANSLGKSWIFCDTTYLQFQRSDDHVRDKDGKYIIEEGKRLSLGEWEAKHERNFNDNWYFWFDLGDEVRALMHNAAT